MDKVLQVISDLEQERVIGKYAIGGTIGALFYSEPVATFNLDIFCFLPHAGPTIDLRPLYKVFAGKGYYPNEAEQIVIEGIPVQFLVPSSCLVEEALDQAVETKAFGVPTRVFSYEHLLAIMAETGRQKDLEQISQCPESKSPDTVKLDEVLTRHKLLDRWSKITTWKTNDT